MKRRQVLLLRPLPRRWIGSAQRFSNLANCVFVLVFNASYRGWEIRYQAYDRIYSSQILSTEACEKRKAVFPFPTFGIYVSFLIRFIAAQPLHKTKVVLEQIFPPPYRLSKNNSAAARFCAFKSRCQTQCILLPSSSDNFFVSVSIPGMRIANSIPASRLVLTTRWVRGRRI